MTGQEVKALTGEQLTSELAGTRKRLLDLRMKRATEKIEDNSLFRKLKKDVARLMQERHTRAKGGAMAGAKAGTKVGAKK